MAIAHGGSLPGGSGEDPVGAKVLLGRARWGEWICPSAPKAVAATGTEFKP